MSLLTSQQCYKLWGDPETRADEGKYMVMWDVPRELEIGMIPKRLYCHKLMIEPLSKAFKALIDTGHVKELKTWDGCFNVRAKRGLKSYSLHSWGVAVDMNAAWNRLGEKPSMSPGFVKCFTDHGFDWGGLWTRQDGMHFQLKASLAR